MKTPLSHPDGPIVILGASYAGGWQIDRIAGIPVVNKGITGQQSFELLARFEADVVAARPRAVVIWGFINDVFRTPREQVDEAMTRAMSSYEQMVALARKHGIEPILATEVTARHKKTLAADVTTFIGGLLGKTSYQDYVNGHVLRGNGSLRELARREGVLLLDIQKALSDANDKRRKEYSANDGSHISPEGYEALTRYATPRLEAHFRRP